MTRKNAIVTGASGGFGFLSVLELAKHGFQVMATMRDVTKAKLLINAAKDQNLIDFIQIQPLDVTVSQSINEFKLYISQLESVDLLVNNAGIAVGGFCEELSIEDYRNQLETNLFGVISVTQTVLPYMRAQQQGRIINMSSISGRFGFPGMSAYATSKHALEGFSESLRLEVKPFGIDVVLIEPGAYQTNIWSSMDHVPGHGESPYDFYMNALKNEIETGKTNHGNPQEVAELVAQIATQSKPPNLRYPIGKKVKTNIRLKNLLPWKIIESTIVKKLLKKRHDL